MARGDGDSKDVRTLPQLGIHHIRRGHRLHSSGDPDPEGGGGQGVLPPDLSHPPPLQHHAALLLVRRALRDSARGAERVHVSGHALPHLAVRAQGGTPGGTEDMRPRGVPALLAVDELLGLPGPADRPGPPPRTPHLLPRLGRVLHGSGIRGPRDGVVHGTAAALQELEGRVHGGNGGQHGRAVDSRGPLQNHLFLPARNPRPVPALRRHPSGRGPPDPPAGAVVPGEGHVTMELGCVHIMTL